MRERTQKSSTNLHIRIIHLSAQSAITVCLGVSLGLVIAGDYNRIKEIQLKYPLGPGLRVDSDKVQTKARLMTLNHMMPQSYDYLNELARGQAALDRERVEEYLHYYEKLTEYMPSRADAYGLMGFCYYQLGKYEESMSSYKKAILLYPDFSSFYFNPGAIYFQNGQYEAAAEFLQKAVSVDLADNLKLITSSRVYFPLISGLEGMEQAITMELKAGYTQGYKLLIMSLYHSKDFTGAFRYANEAIASSLDEQGFFYYSAGFAAYQLKEYKQAVSLFQECITRNPEHTEAFYYLGQTLMELGIEETAAKTLGQAAFLQKTKGPAIIKEDKTGLRIF